MVKIKKAPKCPSLSHNRIPFPIGHPCFLLEQRNCRRVYIYIKLIVFQFCPLKLVNQEPCQAGK